MGHICSPYHLAANCPCHCPDTPTTVELWWWRLSQGAACKPAFCPRLRKCRGAISCRVIEGSAQAEPKHVTQEVLTHPNSESCSKEVPAWPSPPLCKLHAMLGGSTIRPAKLQTTLQGMHRPDTHPGWPGKLGGCWFSLLPSLPEPVWCSG